MTENPFNNQIIDSLWQAVPNDGKALIKASPFKVEFCRSKTGNEGIIFFFPLKCELKLSPSAGFDVIVESNDQGTSLQLIRMSSDDQDMYLSLCSDLLALSEECDDFAPEVAAGAICDRISAWQEFMRSTRRKFSDSKELGLFGELTVLDRWLEAGGHLPQTLSDIWGGPIHSARDFSFGNGYAIEVKTSLSDKPFKATIESLEQLDSTECAHLALAAVKLNEKEDAPTLRELCQEIRLKLKQKFLILEFDSLLVALGFNEENPGRTLRHFETEYIKAFDVNTLPRLVHGTIPGIISGRYEILITAEDGKILNGIEEIDFPNLLESINNR